MEKVTNYISIVILSIFGILWPIWFKNGYLEELYPRIGSFIAVYGGLIANIFYFIKNRK